MLLSSAPLPALAPFCEASFDALASCCSDPDSPADSPPIHFITYVGMVNTREYEWVIILYVIYDTSARIVGMLINCRINLI